MHLLRLRVSRPPVPEPEGLGALFVRRREVRPQEIRTCYLRSLEHAPHVADQLKNRYPIIVNLEELRTDEMTRALDFISGAAYALDGCYDEVGEHVFLFVPGNVVIAGE